MRITTKLDIYFDVEVPDGSDRSIFTAIFADSQTLLEYEIVKHLQGDALDLIPKKMLTELRKHEAKKVGFLSKTQLLNRSK